MEKIIRIITPKLLLSPYNFVTYVKKKKILHKSLVYFLVFTIFIFLGIIIYLLITIFYYNKLIKESTKCTSNQRDKVTQFMSQINFLQLKIDELNAITKSLEFNLGTSQYIDPILSNGINHLKNKVSPLYHHFSSLTNLSSIIEGVDELMMLFNWMPFNENVPRENIIISLLYKGSRDSDDNKVFHLHCDNRSPFLILIKGKGTITNPQTNQTEEVIIRFGGISNAKIQSNKQFIKALDDSLVIFSLDNGGKYKIDRNFSGLYTGSEMLINFGFLIYLVGNWKNNSNKLFLSHTYREESSYLYKDKPWPYQDQYYIAEEVEFFHIKINSLKIDNATHE